MSLPLDIGNDLIDRTKSSLFLYYLARSYHRMEKRQIHRKKIDLSIKRLRKLSTKNLHQHLDELQAHVNQAIARETFLKRHQDAHEDIHKDLKNKIVRLEGKLGKYVETQEERKKRVAELEAKIKNKFEGKKDRLKSLKDDYKRLLALYKEAKHSDVSKPKLLALAKRMDEIQRRIAILEPSKYTTT